MNFNNFMRRIICFSISSIMFANNSFAGKIIINNSSKSSQLKNKKKPVKNNTLFKLFEKWDNLTPEKKKYIISEIFGWGTAFSNVFFIKKLYNALFLNQSTKASSITKNEQKKTTQTPSPSASPTPSLIPKPKQLTPLEPKYDSPFANLEWRNNNCYIDATLQILYEDKEFREYVEQQAINENFGNMFLEDQNEHTKKYISLYQIFKDMDNYKGKTVPYNSARQNFEKALGHKDNQGDTNYVIERLVSDFDQVIDMFAYVPDIGNFGEQSKDRKCNDAKKSVLINFCRAAGDGDHYTTKTIQKYSYTIELPEIFEQRPLKGLIIHQGLTGNSGHYVAYKADDKGQWWLLDDCGCTNEISYNSTTELISDSYIQSNVFCAYYQAVTT